MLSNTYAAVWAKNPINDRVEQRLIDYAERIRKLGREGSEEEENN